MARHPPNNNGSSAGVQSPLECNKPEPESNPNIMPPHQEDPARSYAVDDAGAASASVMTETGNRICATRSAGISTLCSARFASTAAAVTVTENVRTSRKSRNCSSMMRSHFLPVHESAAHSLTEWQDRHRACAQNAPNFVQHLRNWPADRPLAVENAHLAVKARRRGWHIAMADPSL